MEKTSYSFLVVGKTQETSDSAGSFKRYVGLGASKVLAVNPTKAELEKIFGRTLDKEPDYTIEKDGVKGYRVDILVQTVPELCNGIDVISHANFNLYPTINYNRDKSKVRVVDNYGNAAWVSVEDAKEKKPVKTSSGASMPMDTNYRMSFVGEVGLLDFLRKFLYNQSAFNMVNDAWTKKENADDFIIGFEKPKDLLAGNVKEIKDLIALEPNNTVKLLYGVRTSDDGKHYQVVCTDYDFIFRNYVSEPALLRLKRNLEAAKAGGMYANTDFRACELEEYTVEATDLNNAPADSSNDMPWS